MYKCNEINDVIVRFRKWQLHISSHYEILMVENIQTGSNHFEICNTLYSCGIQKGLHDNIASYTEPTAKIQRPKIFRQAQTTSFVNPKHFRVHKNFS